MHKRNALLPNFSRAHLLTVTVFCSFNAFEASLSLSLSLSNIHRLLIHELDNSQRFVMVTLSQAEKSRRRMKKNQKKLAKYKQTNDAATFVQRFFAYKCNFFIYFSFHCLCMYVCVCVCQLMASLHCQLFFTLHCFCSASGICFFFYYCI